VVAVGVVAPPVAPRGTSVADGHEGADVLDGPLVLRDLRPGDRATQMLASLQSNIVHPHVRSHLRLLALRIVEPGAARRGLAAIAEWMKSAAEQLDELQAFRDDGRPGSAFVAIALSATGYARLGVERTRWPAEPAFRAGLRARDLGDPDPASWEAPYRDGIDVIVLVGSHDDALADARVRRVRELLGDSVDELAEETGHTLTNADGDAIEHFGYVDGRSQPLFIEEDLVKERETTGGVDDWNPLVPLSHVLVRDPAIDGEHAHGSYLVYRKLEQDVRAFKEQEARVARELDLTGENAERAGALLIGRYEDGTPLALAADGGMGDPVPNDFTYDDDARGARCPLGAHVRRMNPRVADPAARIVIARRGQGYGVRTDDPSDDDLASKPRAGVGLLFMAVVARLEQQFEQLQRAANGDDGGPFDAVTGQRRAGEDHPEIALPNRWDDPDAPLRRVVIQPVVTLRGGEYCFLPSIDFLRGLADG
jgi:Dyp-type peroxidase family